MILLLTKRIQEQIMFFMKILSENFGFFFTIRILELH